MIEKMTINQAAEYLGTTRQKVSRMIQKGKLTVENNPMDERQKLVDKAELDRLKDYKPTGPKKAPAPAVEDYVSPPPLASTTYVLTKQPVAKVSKQDTDIAWALVKELKLSISQVRASVKKLGLLGKSYEEVRAAVIAERFKK